MAYRRTLIPDFNLSNPIYAYATIYVYGVSGGAKDTSNRPTLYDASVGGDTLANPQKLDEHGKWKQPVYGEEPVIIEAVPLHSASHDTGIIAPTIDNQGITMSYAGDPNTNVAGDYIGQRLLDTTNDRIYTCTTAGIASAAVWTLFGHNSSAFAGDLLDDATPSAMLTTLGVDAAKAQALGTAAVVDTGVAVGNVPAMDAIGYPAANGSQITDVVVTYDNITNATGMVLQTVQTQDGAVATGTTTIPVDDTIPQKTEGDEYMTLAITPKSASSRLMIQVVAHLAHSAGGFSMGGALFQDAVADAIAAMRSPKSATTNSAAVVVFTHNMASPGISAITFKFRGGSDGAGTTTFNGQLGARTHGGVMASSIHITEYLA